jgi:hypothetical protein
MRAPASGPIHLAHPSLADLVDDPVVAEGATDEVLHCWGSQRVYGIAASRAKTIFEPRANQDPIIVTNYLKLNNLFCIRLLPSCRLGSTL